MRDIGNVSLCHDPRRKATLKTHRIVMGKSQVCLPPSALEICPLPPPSACFCDTAGCMAQGGRFANVKIPHYSPALWRAREMSGCVFGSRCRSYPQSAARQCWQDSLANLFRFECSLQTARLCSLELVLILVVLVCPSFGHRTDCLRTGPSRRNPKPLGFT